MVVSILLSMYSQPQQLTGNGLCPRPRLITSVISSNLATLPQPAPLPGSHW